MQSVVYLQLIKNLRENGYANDWKVVSLNVHLLLFSPSSRLYTHLCLCVWTCCHGCSILYGNLDLALINVHHYFLESLRFMSVGNCAFILV